MKEIVHETHTEDPGGTMHQHPNLLPPELRLPHADVTSIQDLFQYQLHERRIFEHLVHLPGIFRVELSMMGKRGLLYIQSGLFFS